MSSLEPQFGSISEDLLEQFVLEDDWYFSDDEEESSDSEDSVSTEDEESLLPSQGPWIELCASSSKFSSETTVNPYESVSDLQSVIDHFLSKLGSYDAAYDEESTDVGMTHNTQSDTIALLNEGEDRELSTPVGTLERGGTRSVDSDKDHPEPVVRPISITSEESESRQPHYFFIAQEILTSERTYVQGLRLLEKVLHGALKTARDSGKPLIPEGLRKRIFLNIGEIHALSCDLLDELEKRLEQWDTNSIVADVMATRAPFFKLYSMYTSRYDDALTAYGETLNKYKPFTELVQHIENSHLCKGLPVTSYMLYPIQRIPRYRLLLEDYLKHLPVDHPDRKTTKDALRIISDVAQHLNDRINELEQQATVVKLQKLFTGKETLVAPGRKFLLRGSVDLFSGRKLNRKKSRILFLFSDILLMTRITRSNKFKIKQKFPLKDVQVSSMYSHKKDDSFCLFIPSFSKPFRFCARNRKERDVWVRHLRKAIAVEAERQKSFDNILLSHVFSDPAHQRSVQSIVRDPSFEPRQPKCVRRSHKPAHRRLIISPSPNIDDGLEEVDAGMEEILLEMEIADIEDDLEELRVLKPGVDNTLSSYISYQLSSQQWIKRWYILTYTALTGYTNHKTDEPCWAISLSGYRLILSTNEVHGLKLKSPDGFTHCFRFDNEYDYTRWRTVLQEILNSDINR